MAFGIIFLLSSPARWPETTDSSPPYPLSTRFSGAYSNGSLFPQNQSFAAPQLRAGATELHRPVSV